MVKICLVAATALLWPAASQAQSIDWREAGGDLFGRPAAVETVEVADAAGFAARLPPLSQPFMEAIDRAADRHGFDPKLLHALVITESAYRADACSSAGACGLTQLMPGTAAELGVNDRFDVEQNLSGGADYLARQLMRFGDVRLALAAYNSGPGRVARLGRIPEIAATRAYVVSVVECYLALSAGRGARNSRECRPPEGGL
ncbi:soluble lytic murein transglycosylase-like protein [Brevundimonas sp. UYEF29]|uniref:lytic transglycosylase domain-containing protein n=1 Tax=Brevundimonas TaxID=41275 RepID=UPI0033986441